MTNRTRRYIGLSLIFSAITILNIFIVTCFKKKNFWAALAAVAAIEGGIGAYLVSKNPNTIKVMKPSEEDYYFMGEKQIEKKHKKSGFSKGRPFMADVQIEIPKDEEATEADFM